MIELTKFNDKKILLNCDLIEVVEETPDTVITLTSGKKVLVKESRQEICEKVIEYRRKISVCRFNAEI